MTRSALLLSETTIDFGEFMKVFVGSLMLAGLVPFLAPERCYAQSYELLWPKGAPGALSGVKPTDTANNPYLRFFPAPAGNANGAAMVVCPGGGYVALSTSYEGDDVAKWFNNIGISGFVLRYRLGVSSGNGGYHHPAEMWDGQRAIRWVRANAKRFGIDTNRVGITGFSAGGHLAATVATHYDSGSPGAGSIDYYPNQDSVDRFSCRPDFVLLGYPVITMDASFTHMGSRIALLGYSPSADLVTLLSNEKQVTSKSPPAFLTAALNDGAVPVKNSQVYADSCKKKGVNCKLVLYPSGNHGFGLADGRDGAPNYADVKTWPDSAAAWLQKLGFLTAPTALQSSGRPRNSQRGSNQEIRLRNAEGRIVEEDGASPLFKP